MTRIFSRAATAAAIMSLAAAPALAAPGNPASQLSLRAATASKNSSKITPPPLIAVIGILAIVGGGIWVAVDDDSPDSP